MNNNIYETLLSRTPEGELFPLLATDFPTRIDETTWQFKLREDVRFHNEEPFNANAVAHSVKRMIDPDYGSERSTFLAGITDAVAVDEHTINVITEEPDPVLPTRLYLLPIVPVSYSEDASFENKPVGTGPYKFIEWSRGEHLRIEVNPDYWGDRPSVEDVTFRFVVDAGPRLAGVIGGEFDLAYNVSPEEAERVPQLITRPGLEHPMLVINALEGPTADPRVREALNLALDRQAIAESLFEGFARPVNHLFVPETFGFSPELPAYSYDPERARQLVRDAGAEGATIELLGTRGRWLKAPEVAQAIGSYWEEIGLSPEVNLFAHEEYINRVFDPEVRPSTIYLSHANQMLDADLSLSAYYAKTGFVAANDNDQLTAIVARQRRELDADRRLALIHQALEIGYELDYFIPVVNHDDIYGASERLVWTPRLDGELHIEDMRLKEA